MILFNIIYIEIQINMKYFFSQDIHHLDFQVTHSCNTQVFSNYSFIKVGQATETLSTSYHIFSKPEWIHYYKDIPSILLLINQYTSMSLVNRVGYYFEKVLIQKICNCLERKFTWKNIYWTPLGLTSCWVLYIKFNFYKSRRKILTFLFITENRG